MCELTNSESAIKLSKCMNCAKQFAPKSTKGMYCSRACHYAHRRATTLAQKGTNCSHCGKRFHRSPSHMIGTFCSMECFGLWKTKPETRACPKCGGVKSPGAKGCMACRAKAQLRSAPTPCRQCGAPVYRSPAKMRGSARTHGVFCNRDCHAAFVVGPNNAAYIDGRQPAAYVRGWDAAKRRVLKRDGRVCFICSGTKRLDVHHIDRNRGNHRMDNLVTLCRRCHANQHLPPLELVMARSRALSQQLNAKFGDQVPFST